MDGAIIFDWEDDRIVRAGVQLMPDPSIDTVETGTRHRTADRVSRQSGPAGGLDFGIHVDHRVVSGQHRHLVEHSDQILTRAHQALQTLERYRGRLWEVTTRLSSLEVQDQVTVRDFALVAQRLEMVRRLEDELDTYVVELGSGRTSADAAAVMSSAPESMSCVVCWSGTIDHPAPSGSVSLVCST